MDKFNPDSTCGSGRGSGSEDGELACAGTTGAPWDRERAAGVVLLGFACDEGAPQQGACRRRRWPLAVRKLLANTAWHLNRPRLRWRGCGLYRWQSRRRPRPSGRAGRRALDLGHFPLVLGAVTRWRSAAGAA